MGTSVTRDSLAPAQPGPRSSRCKSHPVTGSGGVPGVARPFPTRALSTLIESWDTCHFNVRGESDNRVTLGVPGNRNVTQILPSYILKIPNDNYGEVGRKWFPGLACVLTPGASSYVPSQSQGISGAAGMRANLECTMVGQCCLRLGVQPAVSVEGGGTFERWGQV